MLQALYLLLGTAFIYALAHGLAWLLGRLVTAWQAPFWRAALSWGLFQAYVLIGLLRAGALPAPAGSFLAVTALVGVISLALALFRRQRAPWRTRALLLAWAIPWAIAWIFAAL